MRIESSAMRAARITSRLLAQAAAQPASDTGQRWLLLQAAHVVGQGFFWSHVQVHIAMLAQAGRGNAWCEMAGQLWRLALVPLGHLTGRLPWGNTGRSDVSAFRPMQPGPELLALIESVRKCSAPNNQ